MLKCCVLFGFESLLQAYYMCLFHCSSSLESNWNADDKRPSHNKERFFVSSKNRLAYLCVAAVYKRWLGVQLRMRCVCVLSFFHLNQVTWRWHFDWLFFIYICAVSRAVIRFPYNAGVGCNWGGLFLLGRLFNTWLRCHMFAYALVLVHKFSVNFRSTDHRFLTKQHLIRYGQSAPFFRYFVISARIFSSFFFHFVRLLLSFHSIRVRFFHLTKRTYILFVSLGPLSSGAAVNKISSDKQEFPLP